MVPENVNERRQIELLYLIYIAPLVYGDSEAVLGDSTFPVGLDYRAEINKWWRTKAEDLAYKGLIRLFTDMSIWPVVDMTPAGRAQAEKWEAIYRLDQRLEWDEQHVMELRQANEQAKDFLGLNPAYFALPRFLIDWDKVITEQETKIDLTDDDVYKLELSREAKRYGIKPQSMELWRKMKYLREFSTWVEIRDRLAITDTKMKYHRRKMRASGYLD